MGPFRAPFSVERGGRFLRIKSAIGEQVFVFHRNSFCAATMVKDGHGSGRKEKTECNCGHYYGLDDQHANDKDEPGGTAGSQQSSSTGSRPITSLDSSFVHLPPSLLLREEERTSPRTAMRQSQQLKSTTGYLDSFRHLAQLEQAANSVGSPPRLCIECVQRVERSLDADTERLDNECNSYRDAMRKEEERVEGLKRALKIAASSYPDTDSEEISQADFDRTEQTFRNEIHLLQEACQQHEDELRHLDSLRKDQAMISRDLDRLEYATEEEQNALELEARAFDNDQEQLYHSLAEIQAEVEQLSSSHIRLPSMLMKLQVDRERGLRYPLINELRLAYRPKGDVQWNEIQAAWSLAAQLLLVIATLFDFQSQYWKIVPLSHCAKLIYYAPESSHIDPTGKQRRAVVYNLGHPKTNGSKALSAWNALLFQVMEHTTTKINQACDSGILDHTSIPPLPFEIAAGKIGNIVLVRLDENDDAGWSRAIHFMSSNLLWLSECASAFVLQQVLLTTATVA